MPVEKTIYDLKLHEAMEIAGSMGGKIEVTRVPGGWVYAFEYPGYRQSPIVFVAWHNEFQGVVVTKPKTKK